MTMPTTDRKEQLKIKNEIHIFILISTIAVYTLLNIQLLFRPQFNAVRWNVQYAI